VSRCFRPHRRYDPLYAVVFAMVGACTPGHNETDSPPPPPDTSEPDTESDTIFVAPHCQLNEVEPNNRPGEEQDLAFEQLACGALQQNLDGDLWRFTVDHATWVGVYLDAQKLGSRVDGIITLQGTDIAQQHDSPGSLDPILRFPTTAGASEYTVLITDQQGLGEEQGYDYELLVTEVKQPVDSNRVEVEPNDDDAHAQVVADGDAIFGSADGFGADWFAIDVPAGKHDLTVDVAAWSYGSTGLFAVNAFDSAGVRRTLAWGAPGAWDPVLHLTSTGNERLYINIAEREHHQGRTYWYVARISLEAQ